MRLLDYAFKKGKWTYFLFIIQKLKSIKSIWKLNMVLDLWVWGLLWGFLSFYYFSSQHIDNSQGFFKKEIPCFTGRFWENDQPIQKVVSRNPWIYFSNTIWHSFWPAMTSSLFPIYISIVINMTWSLNSNIAKIFMSYLPVFHKTKLCHSTLVVIRSNNISGIYSSF